MLVHDLTSIDSFTVSLHSVCWIFFYSEYNSVQFYSKVTFIFSLILILICYVVVKVVFVLFSFTLWFRHSHGGSQVNGSGIRRPTTLMTQNDRKLVSPPQNLVLTIHKDASGYGMKVGFPWLLFFSLFFYYLFTFPDFYILFLSFCKYAWKHGL